MFVWISGERHTNENHIAMLAYLFSVLPTRLPPPHPTPKTLVNH